MATTRLARHVAAPPSVVYRALTDPDAVQRWMVPDDMTSEVHTFEPHEGGHVRISLTYLDADREGKTASRTDTHHGRFVRLVPDELVVQTLEFETDDPALQGEMTITYELAPADDGGTDLVGTHEGLPAGVRPEDNELGWSMSLAKLAALAEGSS